jgi:hypothetical protein
MVVIGTMTALSASWVTTYSLPWAASTMLIGVVVYLAGDLVVKAAKS